MNDTICQNYDRELTKMAIKLGVEIQGVLKVLIRLYAFELRVMDWKLTWALSASRYLLPMLFLHFG